MDKRSRNTILFIGFIVILAGGIYFLQGKMGKEAAAYVVIAQDGKESMRLDLTEDKSIRVDSPYEGYNLVQIKDKKVSVIEADCENQLCVLQGEIEDSHGVIVCLPHAMVITIEEAK